MLRLLKLKLANFMNIKEAEIDFSDFNFIYGHPASGKSAVLEAISVCISDEKRSSTYGAYVMQGCDKALVDMLCLIDGQNAHFIVNLNRVEGTPWEATLEYNGQTYKNSKIKELLKSKHIDYYASIMFSMQHDDDVVSMTATRRLFYMQELLNFSFEEERQQLAQKQASNKSSIVAVSERLKSYSLVRDSLKPVDVSRIKTLSDSERASIESEALKTEKLINEANEKNKLASQRLNERYKLKSEISMIEQKTAALQNAIEQSRQAKKAAEEREAKAAELGKKIESLDKSRDGALSLYDDAKHKLEALKEKLDTLVREQNETDKEKTIVDNKVALIKKGFCPECGQKTDHLDDTALGTQKTLEERIASLSSSITEMKRQIKEVDDKVSKLAASIASADRETYKAKIELESLSQKTAELEIIDESEIDKLNEVLASKKKSLAETSETETVDVQPLYSKLSICRQQISQDDSNKKHLEDLQRINERNAQKLSEAEKNEEADKASLDELSRQDATYAECSKILLKQLPQFMSITICKAIQSYMNELISKVFPTYEVRVEVVKNGCNMLYTKNRSCNDEKRNKWLDVKMSSGFERAVLNLSFKVTLAQMYGLDLFVGDEIDKAASDEDSVKIIDLIWSLPNYQQIVIISHNSTLRDHIMTSIEEASVYEADSGKFAKRN